MGMLYARRRFSEENKSTPLPQSEGVDKVAEDTKKKAEKKAKQQTKE